MRQEDDSLMGLYQKLAEAGLLSVEKKSEGLPLINEDTRDSLVSLYGISDKPDVPRYIPRYYDDDDEIQGGPFAEALKVTEDVLSQFRSDDRSGYLYHLASWLNKSFKDTYESKRVELQNSATVGIGAVIKAFEIQLGYSVVEGLENADGGSVLSAFEEEPLKSRTSLINRMLSSKDVPVYQTSLGSFINDFSTYCPNPSAVKDGAAMQYRVFELIWPQLSPNKK